MVADVKLKSKCLMVKTSLKVKWESCFSLSTIADLKLWLEKFFVITFGFSGNPYAGTRKRLPKIIQNMGKNEKKAL